MNGKTRPEHSKIMKEKYINGQTALSKMSFSGENNPRSRWYLITDPKGNVFEIKCLRQFCRDNGLSKSTMWSSLKYGKRAKGWKVEYKT